MARSELARAKNAITVASTDRTVPSEFVGTLEPNYYCRAWNGKRVKYCRAHAGAGTTHPGMGRCKHHGGVKENDKRVSHGRYRSIRTPRIRQLLDELAEDPDPLNVLEDLQLARALLHDYVERASAGLTARLPEAKLLAQVLDEYEILLTDGGDATDQQSESLAKAREAITSLTAERALPDVAEAVRFLDVVSKMVHRLEQLRSAGAFSLQQVHRFLLAVDRVVQLHVSDEPLRQAIRRDLSAIRV